MMPLHILTPTDTPWNLWDVVARLMSGEVVHGFELELLADYVSRRENAA